MPESSPHRRWRESQRFRTHRVRNLARHRSKSPCPIQFCCCVWWFWPAATVAGMTNTVNPHLRPPPSRISSLNLAQSCSLSLSVVLCSPAMPVAVAAASPGRPTPLLLLSLSLSLSLRFMLAGEGSTISQNTSPLRASVPEEEKGLRPFFVNFILFFYYFFGCFG